MTQQAGFKTEIGGAFLSHLMTIQSSYLLFNASLKLDSNSWCHVMEFLNCWIYSLCVICQGNEMQYSGYTHHGKKVRKLQKRRTRKKESGPNCLQNRVSKLCWRKHGVQVSIT